MALKKNIVDLYVLAGKDFQGILKRKKQATNNSYSTDINNIKSKIYSLSLYSIYVCKLMEKKKQKKIHFKLMTMASFKKRNGRQKQLPLYMFLFCLRYLPRENYICSNSYKKKRN